MHIMLAGRPTERHSPAIPVNLLTSVGEIPPDCEIADLLNACNRIRNGFAGH